MQRLMICGVALVAVGLFGCNKSEPGGKKNENTPSSETFTLSAPSIPTTIKQGDKKTVNLTLDRGKTFKQDITLKATPPSGLKVDVEPKVVKASDEGKATMTITAEKDAALGENTIKVTATPEKGNAVDREIKVKIEKKSD